MQQRTDPEDALGVSETQWQARVDLAAAHRMAVMHGFHEGIFNHFTLAVPDTTDRYYQIPFGLHWSEVNASCFMEVSFDGERLKGSGDIERSAFCIHAPIHRALPENGACVLHTHMPFCSALTRLEDQRIKPIGQTEIGMMRHIAYDDHYTGPAVDPAEGERLVEIIGDKTILFMANHGVTVIGRTIAQAYDQLYYIERAAQVQVYAMSTGQPLRELPADVIAKTLRDFSASATLEGPSPSQRHFDALKRILDRREPDYRD